MFYPDFPTLDKLAMMYIAGFAICCICLLCCFYPRVLGMISDGIRSTIRRFRPRKSFLAAVRETLDDIDPNSSAGEWTDDELAAYLHRVHCMNDDGDDFKEDFPELALNPADYIDLPSFSHLMERHWSGDIRQMVFCTVCGVLFAPAIRNPRWQQCSEKCEVAQEAYDAARQKARGGIDFETAWELSHERAQDEWELGAAPLPEAPGPYDEDPDLGQRPEDY